MELMYRHGGVSQAEIGRVLGNLDYTAVSRERKRLRERMEKAFKDGFSEIEAISVIGKRVVA